MGFTPSGSGSSELNITISAEDNASSDINDVQENLRDLGETATGTGGLMGRLKSAVDDAADEIRGVVDDATAASGSLQTLQGRADEAENEMEQLGDETSQTATKMGALSTSTGSAASTMAAFGGVTAATAVPSLVALSSVAVPLVGTLGAMGTALGGVAAGFSAVIGTGAYAYGTKLKKQNEKRLSQINTKIERLQTVKEETGNLTKAQQRNLQKLKQQRKEVKKGTTVMGALAQEMQPVKEQLRDSALRMGQEFIPVVRDAIDALPQFIRNVEKAIGPLEPFAQALRELGQTAYTVFPNIVSQVMDMAREILPEFVSITKTIMKNVVPALEGMMDTARKVAPLFEGTGGATVELIKELNQLGLTILQELIPRIRDTIGLINDWNEATDGWLVKGALMASAVGTLIGILGSFGSALAGVLSTLGSVVAYLGGPVTLAIAGVGVAIAGLYKAWQNNTWNIREKTATLQSKIQSLFGLVEDDIAAVGDAVVNLKDNVVSSFSTLKDEFNTLWRTVNEAFTLSEQQTNQLSDTITRFRKMVVGALQTVGKAVDWLVKNHYQPMMKRINSLTKTHLGETVDEFIETIDAIVGYIEYFVKVGKQLWKRYGDEIMAIVKPILKGLRIIFGQTFDTIFTLIRVTLNLIQGDWDEAWTTMKAFLDRTLGRMGEMLSVFADIFTASWDLLTKALGDAWDAVWGAIKSTLKDAFNSMVSWVTNIGTDDIYRAFKAVGSTIRGVFTTLFDAIVGAGGLLMGFFGDIVSYLKNGAKEDTAAAIDVTLSVITDAFDGLVTEVIGENGTVRTLISDIVSYLKNGATEDIGNAIDFVIEAIESAFEGLYDGLIGNSLVKDMFRDIRDYISGPATNYLGNVAGGAVDSITGAFEDIADTIGGYVYNAMDDAQTYIENAISNIISDVEDMFDISIDGPDIDWPEPPEIVEKAYNGNLNIDWPDPPDSVDDVWNGGGGSDDDDGGSSGGGGGGGGGGIDIGVPDPDLNPVDDGNQDLDDINPIDSGDDDDDDDDDDGGSSGGGYTPSPGPIGPGPIGPTPGPIGGGPSFGDDDDDDDDSGGGGGGIGLPDPDLNPISDDNEDVGDIIPFHSGGIVTDPVMGMVGETGKTEAVLPLDKLSNVMKREYRAGVKAARGGSENVNVRLKVEGDDELARIIRENAEIVVEEHEQNKTNRISRL